MQYIAEEVLGSPVMRPAVLGVVCGRVKRFFEGVETERSSYCTGKPELPKGTV